MRKLRNRRMTYVEKRTTCRFSPKTLLEVSGLLGMSTEHIVLGLEVSVVTTILNLPEH